tara:strand:+ start:91 stop:543 length:453 start_codon:yes stop_codon:yes gene_type:complete
LWPVTFQVDYGHEEATAKYNKDPRVYSISTTEFIGDSNANLTGLKTVDIVVKNGQLQKVDGTEKIWKADLVFLSMGFLGPEHYLSDSLGLELDKKTNYKADKGCYRSSLDHVFVAGDCRSGQSLVVRAINEGREAAREIDLFLMGSTDLP